MVFQGLILVGTPLVPVYLSAILTLPHVDAPLVQDDCDVAMFTRP